MKTMILTTASAALLWGLAGAPTFAGDYTQLIRSAGLTLAEAEGMSLDEIAAHKFSREGSDNGQGIVRRNAPGASMPARSRTASSAVDDRARSLDEWYVEMINRSVGYDDRQHLPPRR